MKRPAKNKLINFDTVSQVEKIERAAKSKHWTFTRFVIQAASEAAEQILMASKNGTGRTTEVEPPQLTLNQ